MYRAQTNNTWPISRLSRGPTSARHATISKFVKQLIFFQEYYPLSGYCEMVLIAHPERAVSFSYRARAHESDISSIRRDATSNPTLIRIIACPWELGVNPEPYMTPPGLPEQQHKRTKVLAADSISVVDGIMFVRYADSDRISPECFRSIGGVGS
ncbi:hypothetical protein FGB62_49g11 [Gracilaria domingensis]|nr:hypothetical protein FGB62_49g11 [Gracilaria domingensis]